MARLGIEDVKRLERDLNGKAFFTLEDLEKIFEEEKRRERRKRDVFLNILAAVSLAAFLLWLFAENT